MAEQVTTQTPAPVAPAEPVAGEGAAPVAPQTPAPGTAAQAPVIPADGGQPIIPAGADDQPFEFNGQQFHNKKHFERVVSETLAKAKSSEAELNAIKMREAEAAKDAQLFERARQANPTADDATIRKYIENTKRFANEIFAEEKMAMSREAGNMALHNYVQKNNVPDDIAQGISALYQVPEMADLIHKKAPDGSPILSFNDLRDWAEAPRLRKQVAELSQQIAALNNGAIGAGAGTGGGRPAPNGATTEPPLSDYAALKKWRADNVK